MARHSFDLGMEPEGLHSKVMSKVAERLKVLRPDLNVELVNNCIEADIKDDDEDQIRMLYAFIGHLALKEAEKIRIRPKLG